MPQQPRPQTWLGRWLRGRVHWFWLGPAPLLVQIAAYYALLYYYPGGFFIESWLRLWMLESSVVALALVAGMVALWSYACAKAVVRQKPAGRHWITHSLKWGLFPLLSWLLVAASIEVLRWFVPVLQIREQDRLQIEGSGDPVSGLKLSGGIELGDARRLMLILREQQATGAANPILIQLNSPGGRAEEAMAMAKRLTNTGVDTEVLEHCKSACTLLFAAGQNRWLNNREVKVGFHLSGRSDEPQSYNKPGETDYRMAAWLIDRGVDRHFVAEVLTVPHHKMMYVSADKLVKVGFATGIRPQGLQKDKSTLADGSPAPAAPRVKAARKVPVPPEVRPRPMEKMFKGVE